MTRPDEASSALSASPDPPDGAMTDEPAFVSRQVVEARRYYIDLNPPADAELTVVCGGVERTRSDYVVSRDDFPFYGLEMVAEGQGRLRLGGEEFEITAGAVFAYGPKTPHEIRSHNRMQMRKYYLDFSGTRAETLLNQSGLWEGHPLRTSRIHELAELFELCDREARHSGGSSRHVHRCLLELLMAKIHQDCHAEGPGVSRAYETYERIRGYIEENYLSLHTIQQVASQCDVTPIYLSRLFKRFGDSGAYQYLMRKKMNHAAELLIEHGMMVREVADEMKFADAFQFSRAFKRVYGIPPKELIQARS